MTRKLTFAFLLILALPQSVAALDDDDLLSLVAMPLAVAAVADLVDVPARDLVTVVTALNQAAVPPPQFIEVIRYVPVALIDQTAEPTFVTFVTTQVDQGLTGEAFALALADRLRTFGVQEINVVSPPPAVVLVDQNFIPPVVVTRIGQTRPLPLSLVAMPLAVAAIADLTGVPTQDLISFVTALNQAQVPPPQFIEVVRFVPVVLVDQTAGPQFVSFVTTQVSQGVRSDALVLTIADRLRTFGVREINVVSPPPVVVVEETFVPPVVVTRIAEVRQHPHGGPPGQLKKIVGVQTGAEIVHGEKPGRKFPKQPMAKIRTERVEPAKPIKPEKVEKWGQTPPPASVVVPQAAKGKPQPPGQQKDKSGKGQGKGKGKGER